MSGDAGVAALCIGWDVGGWHGRKDGLAAMLLDEKGHVAIVGRAQSWALGSLIASGLFSIEYLLGFVGMLNETPWPRIVLGVDAPLGLPKAFVASTASSIRQMPRMSGLLPDVMMESDLAYRETERVLFAEYREHMPNGWRPLSPSFAGMGSNISKARAALSQLCVNEPKGSVSVVPFDSDSGRVAAIEVYPALWRAAAGDTTESGHLHDILNAADAAHSAHVRDAFRCALAAACYEITRANLQSPLPHVRMPDGIAPGDPEGWIFAPRPERRPAVT